ncbi:APC family permease [Pararhodonellum marinum]|uniref:APC family permease n=1 Tax=Pararhodonellum marinum TaxID=2755358 RepID=UPI00189031BA|nr:amino acid permease [Pararhodonellum marinum]
MSRAEANQGPKVGKGEIKTSQIQPARVLRTIDAVALIVGIVIGAGIFRTPSLVAANVDSGWMLLLVWLVGGFVSLAGALCYAELATAFPNTGGDYHFLMRAFGKRVAFLFAWARMAVIQTGSIALLAFIFGDYATEIYPLGHYSPVIYAAAAVVLLTTINLSGVKMGTVTQKMLTMLEVVGLLMIIFVGFFILSPAPQSGLMPGSESGSGNEFGLAMVFVLLTYGGWNEAAYISSEMKAGQKWVAKALIFGILLITSIYFLVNFAFLRAMGLSGMAGSNAIASDLMGNAYGQTGVVLISVLVGVAALTSANATIFTGARSNYALGRDFPVFAFMGKWKSQSEGPVNAFILQGAIAIILVSFGLFSRSGFETMIDYTAPVFWFFLLLVGLALFVLRKKEPEKERPFKVPFYPVLPLLFCLSSTYLLYSSLAYTGWGALVGIIVLLIGAILLLFKPSMIKSGADNSS